MGRTYTIKLDDNTKEFYHNVFLANKLRTWVEMFKVLYHFSFDEDVEDLEDKEILYKLSDHDVAKACLSALEYDEYCKYYDEIYCKG